jgi:hypothetical protein
MIRKVFKKTTFKEVAETNPDLAYWLSRTPQERLEAVELLRRQVPGSSTRIKRMFRVVQFDGTVIKGPVFCRGKGRTP